MTLGARHKQYFLACKKRLKEEGLLEKFHYAGVPGLKEKAAFLKELSVFSVPSRFPESRGFAALEAMASGIPVVLPDNGIYRDFVNKGNAGLLVKPNDPQTLAEGIIKIMDDARKADEYGKNAAACAVKDYSQEKMVEETVQFYEREILGLN